MLLDAVGASRPIAGTPTKTRRAVFVAVAPASLGHAEGRADAQHAERRAMDRRLRDEALAAEVAAAPVVLAALCLAVMACVALMAPSPWRDAWGSASSAIVLTWLAVAWIGPRSRMWRRDTRRYRRVVAAHAVCALVVLASQPWLPVPSEPPLERELMLLALGMVSLTAAAAFPATPAVVAAAIALPWSPALFEWQLAGPAFPLPDASLEGLLLSVVTMVVAVCHYRLWLKRARVAIAREDRIRELEAARDAAMRADQEKSRFLAIASHDLRQPVHALGLFAATLEKRLQGTSEEPLVRNVVRSIDGLDRSFYAMLDISRLDAGTIEPNFQHFPLRDLFRRLHMHFAGQAEQAGLGLRFSPGGKSVTSDPQLLERILGNLIQNAIKYTEQGGIVVVARSTATHFNVEVWDTGVGIGPAELPRVFDEFYQAGRRQGERAQGLGMGLAIVKRLARLLGHSLTVASQPGRGTMFRIGIAQGALPDIQDATAAADTLPMPVLQPRTVLIIDDEESIRQGLSLLLEEWGYQALAAADIDGALALARTLEFPPDLILSDLHLGGGPDGLEAIDAVRRDCGTPVPAIVITGDTSHEEMRRLTDSGHPVLFKPVQPRKLLNAMRGLVS